MKQILWFRRDLRVTDSAVLADAKGTVFPIFIFDTNILNKLSSDDKRLTFIYKSVLDLKKKLQEEGLDLAVFYGDPKEIFKALAKDFDEVLCSCDFDFYARKRDHEVEKILPLKRFYDSFILNPKDGLKNDGTPYKVFTPFYKNLHYIWQSDTLEIYKKATNLQLYSYDYMRIPTLKELGFIKQNLPKVLYKEPLKIIKEFSKKLQYYQTDRDYFFKDATSNLSVFLRFGIISPREVFNHIKQYKDSGFYIRELFWREFYNYILYHFPQSESENFNKKSIRWNENKEQFQAWCNGETGVPIIDAAMKYLNTTGMMHNRLRMIVASFLTKNLLLPWQWGERYFALKLLDYEASSNIGSWQWGASTGADSVPYFRVFNPYNQSKKFDKEGLFIKSVLKDLKDIDPKLFHKENGVQSNLFVTYPAQIVDIKSSRTKAIERFKSLEIS